MSRWAEEPPDVWGGLFRPGNSQAVSLGSLLSLPIPIADQIVHEADAGLRGVSAFGASLYFGQWLVVRARRGNGSSGKGRPGFLGVAKCSA